MKELDFEKVLKGIEGIGNVSEFFGILKKGDLSENNKVLITVWQEKYKRFVWEAAFGDNVPIEEIMNKGAADEMANSNAATGNEFTAMDILKSKLKKAGEISICGKSEKCQVYCCTIDEGADSEAEYLVLINIFG